MQCLEGSSRDGSKLTQRADSIKRKKQSAAAAAPSTGTCGQAALPVCHSPAPPAGTAGRGLQGVPGRSSSGAGDFFFLGAVQCCLEREE